MRPLKAGLALLLSLTVIVSLASVAAGDPDQADPAGEELHAVEGMAGNLFDSSDPGDLERVRCRLATRAGVSGDPLPTGEDLRQQACGEGPGPSGETPEAPDSPDPGLASGRDLVTGIGAELDTVTKDAEDAAQQAEDEGGKLLDWLWEPVSGLSHEAAMLARETAQTVEHLAGAVVAEVQDAIATATAVASALMRIVGEALEPPTTVGPSDMQPAAQGEANLAAPLGPAVKATVAAAVIAGGVGLALAAFVLLRRLIGLGGVALLSRIPSSEILKNETRVQVHDIVKSDPGVSLNEIVTRVGISRNAVAYHLAVFESEGIMTSIKDGKYRRYFMNGGKYANGAKNVVSTIKNDVTRAVIRFITAHPGVIQKDVCEAVGTSPSATSWHIRRLEKVGLVEKERVANMVRYRPGPSIAKYDLSDFGLDAPLPTVLAPVALAASA